MVDASESFYETFDLLRNRCSNALHLLNEADNSDDIVIRSDMKKPAEASLFVEAFEAVTHSRFRVNGFRNGISRLHFRKKWVCQHSLSKKGSVMSSEKCSANIYIAVKRVTKFNKARDGFLKLQPPLQAMIKINPHHNHAFVDQSPLRLHKISKEIRECFYEYFRKGLKGIKAKRFHEQNLMNSNFSTLDDISVNPRVTSIYTLYRRWRQLKENVRRNKVPAPDSQSVYNLNCTVDDTRQLLSDSNGGLNAQNVLSSYGKESVNADQEGLEVKPPLYIKKEIKQEVESENKCVFPIISEVCSLAQNADNSFVPYPSPSVDPSTVNNLVPSIENSFVSSAMNSFVPFATNSIVPLVADNIVSLQSSSVLQANASYVSFLSVKPVNNTQLVVYNKSSNTYKVVKYLKVCSPTSASIQSSNQYSSYFPNRIQLPTRIGVQKL